MAGVEEVVEGAGELDATLAGLVLNERGYERLAACGLPHVTMAVAVTDAYNTRNPGRDDRRVARRRGADRPSARTPTGAPSR